MAHLYEYYLENEPSCDESIDEDGYDNTLNAHNKVHDVQHYIGQIQNSVDKYENEHIDVKCEICEHKITITVPDIGIDHEVSNILDACNEADTYLYNGTSNIQKAYEEHAYMTEAMTYWRSAFHSLVLSLDRQFRPNDIHHYFLTTYEKLCIAEEWLYNNKIDKTDYILIELDNNISVLILSKEDLAMAFKLIIE